MKLLLAVAITLLLSAGGTQLMIPTAAEQTAVPSNATTAIDCLKEVWPNLSPSCLRNDRATEARRVIVDRRQ